MARDGLQISARLFRVERKLARELGKAESLEDSLRLCLEAACSLSDLECGGIYLLHPEDGSLSLSHHVGLSDDFIELTRFVPADAPNSQLVRAGKPLYKPYSELAAIDAVREREGLRFVAIVPVMAGKHVVGCLNLGSRKIDSAPVEVESALENLAGQIGHAILRDRALRDVQHREENLESFFNSVGEYLFVLDMEGRILQANEAVLQTFGYRREELIGRPVIELHPEDRREEAGRIVQEMVAGSNMFCPVPLLASDGSQIPVETRVTLGKWNGKPALFGVSRDVRRSLKAEQELRECELRYRNMFDDSPAVVLLVDPENGSIVDANPAASRYYGYSCARLKEMRIADLNDLPDKAVMEQVAETVAAGSAVHRYRHRKAGGEQCNVEVCCSLLHFRHRTLLYSIVHGLDT